MGSPFVIVLTAVTAGSRRKTMQWVSGANNSHMDGSILKNIVVNKVLAEVMQRQGRDGNDRELQETDNKLNVSFTDCRFENNESPFWIPERSGLALVYLPDDTVNIHFRRCMFQNNFYVQDPGRPPDQQPVRLEKVAIVFLLCEYSSSSLFDTHPSNMFFATISPTERQVSPEMFG